MYCHTSEHFLVDNEVKQPCAFDLNTILCNENGPEYFKRKLYILNSFWCCPYAAKVVM